MKPQTYTKKPVDIEAMQLSSETLFPIVDWIGTENVESFNSGTTEVFIKTLEGIMRASPPDFVIKGIKGEFYPCRRDIFEATYNKKESVS